MKTITISLPAELYAALEKEAKAQERSKSFIVRKAIECFLKSHKKS